MLCVAILKKTGRSFVRLLRCSVWTADLALVFVVVTVALLFHLQRAGADALELNLSCLHGMGERGMGLACGQV